MAERMSSRLRVLLADDHEVVRLGLLTLLEDISWVEVVAEAGSAAEAIAAVERLQPEVVIMDIRMPGGDGLDACREITERWPDTRVIMLTSYADDELIFKAIQCGASGYVLKQVGNESLISALEAARRGEAMLDPGVTRRVLQHVRQVEKERQSAVFLDLTSRELEVLAHVAKGKSNGQIAEVLNLSEKTVRNHVSTILSKLGLSNRIEAATYAVRNDIDQYI